MFYYTFVHNTESIAIKIQAPNMKLAKEILKDIVKDQEDFYFDLKEKL